MTSPIEPLTPDGPGSISKAAFVQNLEAALGIEAKGNSTQDTIDESDGKTPKKKTAEAYSPDLMEALYLLWLAGGANPIFIQQITGNATGGMGTIVPEKPRTINFDAMILHLMNQENEICIKMLEAWTDSVKREGTAMKEQMKAESVRTYEDTQHRIKHESHTKSMSPEQKYQEENYSRLEKLAAIDRGIAQGLNDYLMKVKGSTNPHESQDIPLLTASLVITAGMRYEYASIPDTVSSQILVQPIKEGNDFILSQVTPEQAPQLAFLGALMMAQACYLSLGQTIASPSGGNAEKAINYEFAKNYAANIVKLVNGLEFTSLASALVATSIDPSEKPSEERINQLIKTLKIALLSTALALLYKTESSFKDQGGGITGQEFGDMLSGNPQLLDSDDKILIAKQITSLLAELPPAEAENLVAALCAFVDKTSSSSKKLIDVGNLLANIRFGSGNKNPDSATVAA